MKFSLKCVLRRLNCPGDTMIPKMNLNATERNVVQKTGTFMDNVYGDFFLCFKYCDNMCFYIHTLRFHNK